MTAEKQSVQPGDFCGSGLMAVYNSSGLNYIRHMDYLGSSRLATTWNHTVYSKEAYAPFGEAETTLESGTQDRVFTGQTQDTTSGIYDYMFRKYDPTAGRWLSPDPAGWAAVDQTNPQSLDRYAYVMNNPMNAADPLGLSCYISSDGSVQDDGDGNGCTYYDDSGNPTVVAPDINQYAAAYIVSGDGPTTEINTDPLAHLDSLIAFSLISAYLPNGQPFQSPSGKYEMSAGINDPAHKKLSKGQIVELCEAAAAMSMGGTVPGAVPPSGPSEDNADQYMIVPSEEATFPDQPANSSFRSVTPNIDKGNNMVNLVALTGNAAACIGAVMAYQGMTW